jgi:hypothetical protein
MAMRLSQSGKIVHVSHFHVPGFTADADGTYNGSPPIVGASTELTVRATALALLGFLEPLWDNTFTWELTGLAQRQTVGGQPALVRVTPPLATGSTYIGHVGTGGTATTSAQGQLQTILVQKTTHNNRARFSLVGMGGVGYSVDGLVAANGAGTALEQLVNYLLNTAAIQGHDGGGLVGPTHRTVHTVKRSRRLAMRAF